MTELRLSASGAPLSGEAGQVLVCQGGKEWAPGAAGSLPPGSFVGQLATWTGSAWEPLPPLSYATVNRVESQLGLDLLLRPAAANYVRIGYTYSAFNLFVGFSIFNADDNGAWGYEFDGSLKGGSNGVEPLLAFFGGTAGPIQTVTGSRGGNAALESLLTALATYGLVVDGTSA